MKYFFVFPLICLILLSGQSCASKRDAERPPEKYALSVLASPEHRCTGIAVSGGGRIFVSYPRWSGDVPYSIMEIRDGTQRPFPDEAGASYGEDGRFLNVQSIYVDRRGRFWALDNASPYFGAPGANRPALYRLDMETGAVIRKIEFQRGVYSQLSYMNDIRVDESGEFAFVTDSGAGGIVVIRLGTGRMIRILDGHPSVMAESDRLVIDGREIVIKIHSDGLAVRGGYLYYSALSGHTLYKLAVSDITDAFDAGVSELPSKVSIVAAIPACDGMEFDGYGRLVLTGIESGVLFAVSPGGDVAALTGGQPVKWPDSVACRDGALYFTASAITFPKEGNIAVYRAEPVYEEF